MNLTMTARYQEPLSSMLIVREALKTVHTEHVKHGRDVEFAEIKDHRYRCWKVGPETWVAVYEELL